MPEATSEAKEHNDSVRDTLKSNVDDGQIVKDKTEPTELKKVIVEPKVT